MIPILYEATETAFVSNGLGRLPDAISCNVVEERNSIFELNMTYPVNGAHFADIQENRIILAKAFEGGQTQPFIIYRIEKPINGICTIKAEHISYRLANTVVMPFTAGTLTAALAGLTNNSATTNPFNITADFTSDVSYTLKEPRSVRGALGGESGSILDVYGRGDYEFNRFDVILHEARGRDTGVTLRYGKNLTDLKNVVDMTGVYTGIVPFWTDGEDVTVTLPEKVIMSSHASEYPFNIIKTVDFSGDYEEAPTVAQLRAKATSYVNNNDGWKAKHNITVSFVDLWNTEEYKGIAALERVQMCDVVRVIYTALGVNFTTRVIKTDYNVLEERYNSITLGDTNYTLSSVIGEEIADSEAKTNAHIEQAISASEAKTSEDIEQAISDSEARTADEISSAISDSESRTASAIQSAIQHATDLIQGGLGGHVVFNVNADGEPQEILIMDTDDILTAVNVIRMNANGIGFSTSGYAGQYTTAWTIDGHFNADFIYSGNINANLITAGVLQSAGGTTSFNLATGALYSENLTIDSTYFKLSNTGKITSINPDGHVMEIENGVISGYYTDENDELQLSAQLEIGNGYFNILGKLALNGVVGVSGATSFVKGIDYDEESLGNVVTAYTTNQFVYDIQYTAPSVTVTGTASGTVSVSGTVQGQYVTLTGQASLPINATVNVVGGSVTPQKQFVPINPTMTTIKYLKAVEADTGAINSADGLIQSIS